MGISFIEFQVHGEPTIDVVRGGVKAAQNCDMVIGLGGGSVLDTGKAIAALVTNPGDMFDYLEVIGKGQPLVNAPLPYVAIPTTAGTGSEVTRNAVIECTRAKCEGQPTQSIDVATRRAGGPGIDLSPAARDHSQLRAGRAHAIDRAIRIRQSESDDGCDLPRRNILCGTVAKTCL